MLDTTRQMLHYASISTPRKMRSTPFLSADNWCPKAGKLEEFCSRPNALPCDPDAAFAPHFYRVTKCREMRGGSSSAECLDRSRPRGKVCSRPSSWLVYELPTLATGSQFQLNGRRERTFTSSRGAWARAEPGAKRWSALFAARLCPSSSE